MSDKEIILLGGGGHCRSCIDVIEQGGLFKIAGVVEQPGASKADAVLGYPIIGYDNELVMLRKEFAHALVTVGQMGSGVVRSRLFHCLKKMDFTLPVVISPLAHVSRHASIGEGTIVMHNALVNAGAHVGVNCILNTFSLVEHDATVGHGSHLSTGAVLNGNSTLGAGSFVGSNSTVVNGIQLPDEYFFKAGALIVSKEDGTALGENCR